tara:strand:+ start:777477 stop:778910 length:1434 start_codon:yes stop_codon:yes gene_type:complete
MQHAEIVSLFKSYYSDKLSQARTRIDKEGQLPKQNVINIQNQLEQLKELIDNDCDDIDELYGLEYGSEDNKQIHKDLKPIMEKYELDFARDSKEYKAMQSAHKYALRNYYESLLQYNTSVTDYSLLGSFEPSKQIDHNNPEYRLKTIIDKYLSEVDGTMTVKSYNEFSTCLRYLVELYGEQYSITKLDGSEARYVKDCLLKTPAHRNKKKETRGLPLAKQLQVEGLSPFAPRTVNKYLDCYSTLFKWAVNNNYIETNYFEGMSVKDTKSGKRTNFNDEELKRIFAELDKGKGGLAKTDMRYWSTLIFFYTGARRNEIASLTPDDVKYSEETDVHYFKIKDEKKSKRFKKDSLRLVPVHSDLIERGFLDYVERVRKMKGKDLRLLHELTYTNNHGWGKKLTYWFSNVLLPGLDIKTSETALHSTRHTFITRIKENDVNYQVVEAMVGHEGKGMGETVYTHRSERHLRIFKDTIEMLKY